MADEKDRDEEERLSRREFAKGAALTTVALSIGCGDPMEGPDAGDAGGGADGGPASMDAGAAQDAGRDAGHDAGPEPVEPPESVTESPTDFPFGVASGDATATSAIFWTSYAGSASIELAVWEMDGDTYLRAVHVGPATPREGYVHEDVGTLEGGKRYRYAFFVVEGGARTVRSAIGRMRAALPSDAMEPLMIGATSCTNNGRSIGSLGQAGMRDDLDVFLYLGDTTYNDGATTLGDYRGKWEENMGRAEYQSVRAATSALATWDDHEFDNDWNPETFDAARRDAAIQSFFDYQPLRRDPASPDKVYKSVRWGLTAEIFVLDCRSERRPSTRGSTDEYLSRAQMDWLKSGLSASPAVFKIIVNSVPITDFPGAFDFAQNDRWEGYPTQRDEILSHVDDEGLRGVLWVAGDFHLASAQRVATSGPGASQVELLVGPGGQTGNPLAFGLGGPQFDFASGRNNYTALELLPAQGRVRAYWIDDSGSSFEVHEYDIG